MAGRLPREKRKRFAKDKVPRAARGNRFKKIAVPAIVVFLVIIGSTLLLFRSGTAPRQTPKGPPRAVIADQLSLACPNPDFIGKVTKTLRRAGYTVDYYPAKEVTVEFYRNLPLRGYKLIILRVHSARVRVRGPRQSTFTDLVGLFTSEPYAPERYFRETMTGQLGSACYPTRETERYFSIMPAFIRSSMLGRFKNATVILMGCHALRSDELPRALLQKGASVVIGWNGAVSAFHTDMAVERLLQHLLSDRLPAAEAVTRTAEEVGDDPTCGGALSIYPRLDFRRPRRPP